ncbi:hypothetical protein ACFL1G_00010 [Planctomycetota bacterium]
MDDVNLNSRQSIYFGISYVIAGQWSSDTVKRLDFQRTLAEQQLDFPQTRVGSNDFMLFRNEPSSLQIKLASSGPGVSSLAITSDKPVHTLEMFCKEAEAVCGAYQQTWLPQQCQILRTTATIRHLYSCREHAFKFLWEQRLSQNPQDFKFLGNRPVAGGGLRLIMPPIKTDPEPVQIEVRIESFLRQAENMLTETIFVWPKPRLLHEDEQFDSEFRLNSVEQYASGELCDFLLNSKGERKNHFIEQISAGKLSI